ncbi:hypothetical protein Pla123a_07020 [Posidoniimonas polymericola]|uniref:Ice-binding protein C-terminal domain-containing protein n=1 Tax=Posidoniimonas polymericola TaxID=2528002 RepID=A0A5C5ZFM3_9BACT|nr:PEP-CTERM sorting domain-containing protein [Posidoniimonas polymericola]TWT85895.1 hypothetical protein Pla123a_07020 [Posidoniimonas polymericola]
MAKNSIVPALGGRALLLAGALFWLASPAHAFNVITPGDPIIAIDLDFTIGSSFPLAEGPENILDNNISTKYLNFGTSDTGFIVNPAGSPTVRSFTLTTANDAPERDPASWVLYGTNDPIVSESNSNGRLENWTQIDMGALSLTNDRQTLQGAFNVSNSTGYDSYKMIFPTTKTPDTIMQVADVSFFDALDGGGSSLLNIGDPVLAIRDVDPFPSSNSPANELAERLIDRDLNTKYLNFGKQNSGFIISPTTGSTVINKFSITTANDFPDRDPATWELYGTNEAITTESNGIGDEQNWTLIDSGAFTANEAPIGRFTKGDDVTVSNNTAYSSYRMIFPDVRNNDTACCMQISEISLDAQDLAILTVNRQTGAVEIEAVVDVALGNYEIVSNSTEGLTPANWTSIASTNGDPNDAWVEESAEATLLRESDEAGTGADDGRTLLAGQSISLGNIWQLLPSSFEDLQFNVRGSDGSLIGGTVEYTGPEILLGDYSGNGSVGAEDWPAFKAVYGGTYEGATALEAYLGGDLDGDFDSDIHDFNLFVAAAGGAAALFGTVPEPSSLMLFGAMAAGLGLRRRRAIVAKAPVAAAVALSVLCASQASAQYQLVGPIDQTTIVTSIPAGQENENENSGPENLLEDPFMAPDLDINLDLFNFSYATPDLDPAPLQYAGLGVAPKTVFFDYGSSVTANHFVYAQRSGGNPIADRVGQFEFWFSNTDFGGVVPTGEPDSVFNLSPTDNRLLDSVIRPYPLYGSQSGRYVAVRFTVSEISGDAGNIGGHEFHLATGPTEPVVEVNRATGAMTLRNNLSGAAAVDMKSLTIESPSGGLDASSFNGLGGDSGAFPLGNGSGNGWEVGGGSDFFRLAEGYFASESTLAAGVSGLSLGNGYNPLSVAEDLIITYSNAAGEVYNARVTYTGTAPDVLLGDFNDDNVVDAADYTVWRDAFGTTTVLPNDKTPGEVTDLDYMDWVANYGTVGAAPAASAPEPTAALLAGVLSLGFASRRRR